MAKSIWDENNGAYLGFRAQSLQGDPPPLTRQRRYAGDRHIVTLGPNGSGKSRRLLLVNLAELLGWSILVLDVKGELHKMTAAHRAKAGNRIITLDPFGVNGPSDGFNPIQHMQTGEDFPDDALELAETIIRIEGREPHWSTSAQEWATAIMMYVKLAIPNGSFADVRALLSLDDMGIQSLVRSDKFVYEGKTYPGMKHVALDKDWPEIAHKAQRFGDINPDNRELHGIISTALTQTRWLDSRRIKKDLRSNTKIDFASMKQKPTTVYLILPARRVVTHSSWLRLIIGSIVQRLMNDATPGKVPVLLALDEFPVIAGGQNAADTGDGFPIISRNMPLFRGYGLKLWSFFQSLSQLTSIYGKAAEGFIANAGILQSFAAQDVETAEYLSKRSGQTTRHPVSGAHTESINPAAPSVISMTESLSFNEVPMPLMLPQDWWNIDPGFSVYFSHEAKGPRRVFMPWPSELSHMRAICELDPAS